MRPMLLLLVNERVLCDEDMTVYIYIYMYYEYYSAPCPPPYSLTQCHQQMYPNFKHRKKGPGSKPGRRKNGLFFYYIRGLDGLIRKTWGIDKWNRRIPLTLESGAYEYDSESFRVRRQTCARTCCIKIVIFFVRRINVRIKFL